MIANCQLCGRLEKLTFEHVPPKAAFNEHTIKVQLYDHLLNNDSPLLGKFSKSPKGFGGYTLCATCNNNTGDWYARDFVHFAEQGVEILKKHVPGYWIKGQYVIKPLNVLKQIFTMFMSADKGKHLQTQKDLVDFILNKESQNLPERFKIYMYSNFSPYHRMLGWCQVFEAGQTYKWSEINYTPFGYFLTEDSNPAHTDQLDISYFKNFKYNGEADITLTLPYLIVRSFDIGIYESKPVKTSEPKKLF